MRCIRRKKYTWSRNCSCWIHVVSKCSNPIILIIKRLIILTTRFHSFTNGHIPSVCDRTFVGKLFTDGIIPSEYLLQKKHYSKKTYFVHIPSLYRSVIQKKHLPTVLPMDRARQKKKSFPLGIYRRNIFRRCFVKIGCYVKVSCQKTYFQSLSNADGFIP